MAVIPVGEYTPDQPDFQNPGSALVQNVLPRTAQSYAPFPGISAVSTALTDRCQGAYAMQDASGNVRLFMGDATKLYRMDPSSSTPADVSKVAGYTTGSTERWDAALFGPRVMMTNFADPPQSYVEGSSALFADMIASGITDIKARYISVIKDWVFFGNTVDGTFGVNPQRVWWSAINDPTNFPIPGTSAAAAVQSDYQDLLGDFGWVQGVVGNLGTSDGAVFQERGVWRVQYAGPPAIFAFSIAEGVRGTPAPGSIVHLGALVYYLGEDGFYTYDGSSSKPIGFGKIDKTFFNDLDQSYFYRITSCVDPINKIIYWAYPGAGNVSGNPNRIIAYHWALDRFTITATGDIQLEVLLRALSFGYTLEQLDNVASFAVSGSTGGIESGTPSFDSRVWTGGRTILACFDTSHKLNYFTGANLAPTVETSETQVAPGMRAMVTGARPLVDGGTPSISVGSRNRLVDNVTYSTASAMDTNGFCPLRSEGRFLRARITLPAGSTYTHIQGVEVPDENIIPAGTR